MVKQKTTISSYSSFHTALYLHEVHKTFGLVLTKIMWILYLAKQFVLCLILADYIKYLFSVIFVDYAIYAMLLVWIHFVYIDRLYCRLDHYTTIITNHPSCFCNCVLITHIQTNHSIHSHCQLHPMSSVILNRELRVNIITMRIP